MTSDGNEPPVVKISGCQSVSVSSMTAVSLFPPSNPTVNQVVRAPSPLNVSLLTSHSHHTHKKNNSKQEICNRNSGDKIIKNATSQIRGENTESQYGVFFSHFYGVFFCVWGASMCAVAGRVAPSPGGRHSHICHCTSSSRVGGVPDGVSWSGIAQNPKLLSPAVLLFDFLLFPSIFFIFRRGSYFLGIAQKNYQKQNT